MDILFAFLFPMLGYLSGSLPFSIWVTRYVKNVDVRDAGSGHASTTNTIRQIGFGWGALVLSLDIAKGFIPTYLALNVGRDAIPPYVISLTAIGTQKGYFAQQGIGVQRPKAKITFMYSHNRQTLCLPVVTAEGTAWKELFLIEPVAPAHYSSTACRWLRI